MSLRSHVSTEELLDTSGDGAANFRRISTTPAILLLIVLVVSSTNGTHVLKVLLNLVFDPCTPIEVSRNRGNVSTCVSVRMSWIGGRTWLRHEKSCGGRGGGCLFAKHQVAFCLSQVLVFAVNIDTSESALTVLYYFCMRVCVCVCVCVCECVQVGMELVECLVPHLCAGAGGGGGANCGISSYSIVVYTHAVFWFIVLLFDRCVTCVCLCACVCVCVCTCVHLCV